MILCLQYTAGIDRNDAEFPANVRFSARSDISFLSKDLTDHAALPSNWIGGGKRFSGAFRAGAPSPLACFPRACPFFLTPIYFLAPATQANKYFVLPWTLRFRKATYLHEIQLHNSCRNTLYPSQNIKKCCWLGG